MTCHRPCKSLHSSSADFTYTRDRSSLTTLRLDDLSRLATTTHDLETDSENLLMNFDDFRHCRALHYGLVTVSPLQ